MWATGNKPPTGFTLVELMVVLAIAGLVLAVAVPSSLRMYQSMQYRQAVKDVVTGLSTARHQALSTGRHQDVLISPRNRTLQLGERRWQLPRDMNLAVHTAAELNRDDLGVIRFYPEGGSSGGGVDVERPGGSGVRILVDWLMGGVRQEAYDIR